MENTDGLQVMCPSGGTGGLTHPILGEVYVSINTNRDRNGTKPSLPFSKFNL